MKAIAHSTVTSSEKRPINSALLLTSLKALKGEGGPLIAPEQKIKNLLADVSAAQQKLDTFEIDMKDAYRRSNQAGDILDVLHLPIKDATSDTRFSNVSSDGQQALQLVRPASHLLKKNHLRAPGLVARSNQLLTSLFGASHDLNLLLKNIDPESSSKAALQEAQTALNKATRLYQDGDSEVHHAAIRTGHAVASFPTLESELYMVAADRPERNVSSAAADAHSSAKEIGYHQVGSSLSLERAILKGNRASEELSSAEEALQQALLRRPEAVGFS